MVIVFNITITTFSAGAELYVHELHVMAIVKIDMGTEEVAAELKLEVEDFKVEIKVEIRLNHLSLRGFTAGVKVGNDAIKLAFSSHPSVKKSFKSSVGLELLTLRDN